MRFSVCVLVFHLENMGACCVVGMKNCYCTKAGFGCATSFRFKLLLSSAILFGLCISLIFFYNVDVNKVVWKSIANRFITKSPPANFALKVPQTFELNESITQVTSAYFGLFFKDTYGTSSTYDDVEPYDWFAQFTKDLPSWKTFMPQTVHSIQQCKRHNPSKDRALFTSSKSYVTIENDKRAYVEGEYFVAQIQAINSFGNRKMFGGDYFRAVLINNSTSKGNFRDGIPCSVQDHLDGTYTLRAPLLVPGTYVLEVLLCASVELISTYVQWTNGRTHFGFIFSATLASNETVECNSDLLLYDDYKDRKFCNYSNPRNGEPLFCTQPPSGYCSKIVMFGPKYIPNYGFQKPFHNVSEMKASFYKDQPIVGSGSVFQVLSQNETTEYMYLESEEKPNSVRAWPNGYVSNSQWVSLKSNYQHKSLEDFRECFKNKIVYLLGDSTMRQFFLLMVEPLYLNVTTSQPATYYHLLRTGRNEDLNISIYYRTHGLPFRLQGPPAICPYISDVIDGIETGGPEVAVVLTLGLHYLEYHPAFYIHRLLGIKQSILRHNKKYPHTKFVIKGINISMVENYPFEWLAFRYNLILRKLFEEIENVVFIDLWDMTTVWPIATYHPVDKILVDQANIMFRDLCEYS